MSINITRRDFIKGTAISAAGIGLLGIDGIAIADDVAQETTPATPGSIPAYVIDRFVTKPGEGKEFLEYFMQNYAKYAEIAKFSYSRTLVSPPVWLKEGSNEVYVIWNHGGGDAFWAYYSTIRYDSEFRAFWEDVKTRVEYHDRLFCGDIENVEAMSNV